MVVALALALLCVAILLALVFRARPFTEAFTPVVRLTAKEATYADSKAEWDTLRARFGSGGVEFRTVLDVDAPLAPPVLQVPPVSPANLNPSADASALVPPEPVSTSAAKYQERPLEPPAVGRPKSDGPRVEILVNDVVKARYPGAVTAAGIDPWIRANVAQPSSR